MTRKDIAKVFIRMLITFVCMLPVFLLIGFSLYEKISDIVMIIIFLVIAGGVFALEEFIHFKIYQKRQKLKEEAIKNNNQSSK